MSIDYNRLIGLGVASTLLLSGYTLYKQVKTDDQMELNQLVLEQRLALIERNQHVQMQQLKENAKQTKKLAKDVNRLKHRRWRDINHKKMITQLNGIPKVKLYQVKPIQLSPKERTCLEKNIFHEAAYEPSFGMLAVAQVTGNRVDSKHRGTNFCEVVYAPAQFSWTLDKKLLSQKPSGRQWEQTKRIVDMYLAGHRIRGLEKSEFYFARYIKQPSWAKKMKYVHYIGEHMFLNHRG